MGVRSFLGRILRTDTLPLRYLPSFEYPPLKSKDAFRVLRIGAGRSAYDIELSVESASLDNPPSYEAVSYVWGSPFRSKHILCGGCKLQVTESVHEVLRRFRRDDGPTILWIDQVCIDQENHEERSKQVELMSQIYQKASKVNIWLGEATRASNHAMQLMRRVLDVMNDHPNLYKDEADVERHGLPSYGHRDWEALGAILIRPWFHRSWVVQEAAMANNPVVFCGNKEMHWIDFVRVLSRLRFASHSKTLRQPDAFISKPIQHLLDLEEARINVRSGTKQPLKDILIRFRHCEATIPVDKVYAMLALSAEGKHIYPDYRLPASAVFHFMALRFIDPQRTRKAVEGDEQDSPWQNTMDLIYMAGSAYRSLQMPSWVPDWSTVYDTKPIRSYGRAGAPPRRKEGTLKLLPSSLLSLSGTVLDTVTASTPALKHKKSFTPTSLYHSTSTWFNHAESLVKTLPRAYLNGQPRDEAFSRTLLANRISQGPTHRRATTAEAHAYYDTFKFLEALAYQQWEGVQMPDIYRSSWYQSVAAEIQGRAFFVTEKGCMGLGPRGTAAGDVLFLLTGEVVPLVLQRRGEEFVLRGEAFLHGLEDEEGAWRDSLGDEEVLIR